MKKILLTQGKEAIVDEEDFSRFCFFNWCCALDRHGKPRAARRKRVGGTIKYVYLHQEIMNPPKGMVVDHINGNPLDNRRENLRVCSRKENGRNRIGSGKRLGFKGVHKKWSKWAAVIRVDGVLKHLGTFFSQVEAAKAYDSAAIKYFGQFAKLNLPS